jgi:hypothetical protein
MANNLKTPGDDEWVKLTVPAVDTKLSRYKSILRSARVYS